MNINWFMQPIGFCREENFVSFLKKHKFCLEIKTEKIESSVSVLKKHKSFSCIFQFSVCISNQSFQLFAGFLSFALVQREVKQFAPFQIKTRRLAFVMMGKSP